MLKMLIAYFSDDTTIRFIAVCIIMIGFIAIERSRTKAILRAEAAEKQNELLKKENRQLKRDLKDKDKDQY